MRKVDRQAVTILMPTFNAERYLAEALDSILAQTHSNFTLIVVDDGSTDCTRSILQDYERTDSRIRTYLLDHGGSCRAMNYGLVQAETEWVAVMHADDVMEPHRLERQVAFAAEHPGASVISSLVHVIDERGRRIGLSTTELTSPEVVSQMVRENEVIGFHHPAVLLRRSVALGVGGYRQEFWPCEDVDLWNRIAERGEEILVQPEYLLSYRKHGSASSSNIRLLRRKYHYTREAMIRRRRGLPEPTYQQFLEQRHTVPVWRRLSNWYRDEGHLRYKKAVLHMANRSYVGFLFNLSLATLLRPNLVVGKLKSKYFGI